MEKATYLPGQEPPRVEEIDDAAEAYVEKRDARMAAGRLEQEAYEALAAAMHKHELEIYPIPGTDLCVTRDVKEKFKVGKVKIEEPED
jgi:hypothetical protein